VNWDYEWPEGYLQEAWQAINEQIKAQASQNQAKGKKLDNKKSKIKKT
jgi:hypothetical protein